MKICHSKIRQIIQCPFVLLTKGLRFVTSTDKGDINSNVGIGRNWYALLV